MLSFINHFPSPSRSNLSSGRYPLNGYSIVGNVYQFQSKQFDSINYQVPKFYSSKNNNENDSNASNFKIKSVDFQVERNSDKKRNTPVKTTSASLKSKLRNTFLLENQITWPSKELCCIMFICSFILGPFLDGYHSAFHVLSYNTPHPVYLGSIRLFFTDFWVPPLFGLAGIIISTLYILFDQILVTPQSKQLPSWSKVFFGISFFSFQYWASGYLSYDEPLITDGTLWNILLYSGIFGFILFDLTVAGLIVSILTAISGPLIEIILINQVHLYHYLKPNFFGIPLWIIPIYFLGGQAVGNLARVMKMELENRKEKI